MSQINTQTSAFSKKRALYLLISSKTRSRSDLVGMGKELWVWPKIFARTLCAVFKICPPTTKMLGTALLDSIAKMDLSTDSDQKLAYSDCL